MKVRRLNYILNAHTVSAPGTLNVAYRINNYWVTKEVYTVLWLHSPYNGNLDQGKNVCASIPITLVVLRATGTKVGCGSQLSIFDLLFVLLVSHNTCLSLGQLHIYIYNYIIYKIIVLGREVHI